MDNMKTNTLEIKTALQISKPVHEIFEAIVDPTKMTNYFISKSNGRMEENKTLIWEFPEFDTTFPVQVIRIEKDKSISFSWEGSDKEELIVDIMLEAKNNISTVVTITEKSMPINDEGINWLKNNTAGWTNFLDCLKAYLEFGINLRKGGFDFLRKL